MNRVVALQEQVRQTEREREQGSVMVLTLLLTVLLLGLGLSVNWMASSTTSISGNLSRRQEAMNAAETGIQRALSLLRATTAWQDLIDGTPCVATQDDPGDKGNVLCDNATPLEDIRVISAATTTATKVRASLANIRYTIWIRNDAAEFAWCNGTLDPGESADIGDCNGDGANDAIDAAIRRVDTDGRVRIRVEGSGRDGASGAAHEAIVSRGGGVSLAPVYSQAGMNAQGSNSQAGVSIAGP